MCIPSQHSNNFTQFSHVQILLWSGRSIIFLSLPISYKQTISAFPILKCRTGAETHQHCTPQRGASAKVVSQYPEGNCGKCCLEHVPVFFPVFFFNTKKRPYIITYITTLTATLGRELPGVLDFCIFLQRMKKYMRGILVLAASEWLPNWQLIHIVDEVRDVVLTSEHCENNGKHTFHADIRISIRAPVHQTQAHWRNLHDTTRSLSFD